MDTIRALKQLAKARASKTSIGMMYLTGTDYVPGTAIASPPRSMFVNLLKSDSGKLVLRTSEKVDAGTTFYAKVFDPDGSHWRLFTLVAVGVETDFSGLQVGISRTFAKQAGTLEDNLCGSHG